MACESLQLIPHRTTADRDEVSSLNVAALGSLPLNSPHQLLTIAGRSLYPSIRFAASLVTPDMRADVPLRLPGTMSRLSGRMLPLSWSQPKTLSANGRLHARPFIRLQSARPSYSISPKIKSAPRPRLSHADLPSMQLHTLHCPLLSRSATVRISKQPPHAPI